MLYFLMHKDSKLALFKYENQAISNLIINENHKNRLPLVAISPNSIESSIINWIMHRGIPVTRQGIKSKVR